MRDRMTMVGILVLAAALAVGCASSPAAPAAPANASGEAAVATDGPKVVCHLSCSGTEATGEGATEEAAREDVSQYIDQNCKPEDGQYFIFCDPPQ
jgi:hypothetical protein